MEEPNYYAVIPANVRYDRELPDKAKLLYGEITALSNKSGYCYASNKYFADLYGITPRQVIRLINKLIERHYLTSEIEYCPKTKNIKERKLYLVTKMSWGSDKNVTGGSDKNVTDNNINNNNINIINIYNQNCTNLPKINKVTEKRKAHIKAFLKEFTEEDFEKICKIANESDFLIGKNDRGWKADFDFLLRTDKANAILEGKYNFKTEPKSKPSFKQREYSNFSQFYA